MDDIEKMRKFLNVFEFDVPKEITDIAGNKYIDDDGRTIAFLKSISPTLQFKNKYGDIVQVSPYSTADDAQSTLQVFFDCSDARVNSIPITIFYDRTWTVYDVVNAYHKMISHPKLTDWFKREYALRLNKREHSTQDEF